MYRADACLGVSVAPRMDPTELKTTVEQFGRSKPPAPQGGYLTDDEIERAIDEIRNAIKKHSK